VANSKQKPVPEGAKRSPGKSKFSIPRKEAPPIDGSYLDRLFADFQQQSRLAEAQAEPPPPQVIAPPAPQPVAGEPDPVLGDPADAAVTDEHPAEDPLTRQTAVPVPFTIPEHDGGPAREKTAAPFPHVVEKAPSTPFPQSEPVSPRRKRPLKQTQADGVDAALLDMWKKKHRLGKGEVKILRVMLGMCRDAGGDSCHVKIPQLMNSAGLKERQTQLVLRNLRELGLIEKVSNYSNTDRLGTHYRVLLDSNQNSLV